MDIREKLVELQSIITCPNAICNFCEHFKNKSACEKHKKEVIADNMIANGVTVQEYGEWVHPKGYVVSNGFLCSKCGHKEASYYPINPRPGGAYIADENGNFFYPPKLNYCPNCGAKMMPQQPKGE